MPLNKLSYCLVINQTITSNFDKIPKFFSIMPSTFIVVSHRSDLFTIILDMTDTLISFSPFQLVHCGHTSREIENAIWARFISVKYTYDKFDQLSQISQLILELLYQC